jgi:hypothetical protein
MTPQEIFDFVRSHIEKQGPSMEDDICRYRMTDGKSCAVGCLIPDESYSPNMEGSPLFLLVKNFKLPEYVVNNYEILAHLQLAHDDCVNEDDFYYEWDLKMKRIAYRYGLSY